MPRKKTEARVIAATRVDKKFKNAIATMAKEDNRKPGDFHRVLIETHPKMVAFLERDSK